MSRRIISMIMAVVMLLSLLAGCGEKNPSEGGKPVGQKPAEQKPAELLKMSPENTSVTTEEGIKVDVGDYILDGEAELSVQKLPVEDHSDEGYKIEAYDFKLGELHEFDDFVTIRIPYSSDYCEDGQDPARCVGAKYKNETTGKWEDVLFTVDSEAQEVVIYTDHFSYFGLLYVSNEGRRDALITDILETNYRMDKRKALGFGKRIAEDDPTVADDLMNWGKDFVMSTYDYADQLDNAINIATVGDVPDWLSTEIPETNLTLFSALGYVATCNNLMRIAIEDSIGGGASDGDVLNLLRDVWGKSTGYWADTLTSAGGAGLAVGMGGILVIDKMLTGFAEEAQATKLEDVSFVYHHFNDSFTGFGHEVMTPKKWRERIIQILDKHPGDAELAIAALEAGFNHYASQFFDLTEDQMSEVAADTPNVSVKRIPYFTEEEKQQMIDEYIAHLKENVMPAVLTSVEKYIMRKVDKHQLEILNKQKEFYNTEITITIKENAPDGGRPPHAGYQIRFAPLNREADSKNWTIKMSENGEATTRATLIAFMRAGYPHILKFYVAGADPDSIMPDIEVPFVIQIPEIKIEFGGAPSFDEVVGAYENGELTISEVFVSDSLRTELANSQNTEGEYGCDMNEILSGLEAQKGVPNPTSFTISKTGENTGSLIVDEDSVGTVTYDPGTGKLTSVLDQEGITLNGEFKAGYNADKSVVTISGQLKTTLSFDPKDLRIVIDLKGEKPAAN